MMEQDRPQPGTGEPSGEPAADPTPPPATTSSAPPPPPLRAAAPTAGRDAAAPGERDERARHDGRPPDRHHDPRHPGRHRRRVRDLRRPRSCFSAERPSEPRPADAALAGLAAVVGADPPDLRDPLASCSPGVPGASSRGHGRSASVLAGGLDRPRPLPADQRQLRRDRSASRSPVPSRTTCSGRRCSARSAAPSASASAPRPRAGRVILPALVCTQQRVGQEAGAHGRCEPRPTRAGRSAR